MANQEKLRSELNNIYNEISIGHTLSEILNYIVDGKNDFEYRDTVYLSQVLNRHSFNTKILMQKLLTSLK